MVPLMLLKQEVVLKMLVVRGFGECLLGITQLMHYQQTGIIHNTTLK